MWILNLLKIKFIVMIVAWLYFSKAIEYSEHLLIYVKKLSSYNCMNDSYMRALLFDFRRQRIAVDSDSS